MGKKLAFPESSDLDHLTPASQEWVEQVEGDFELEAHHRKVLLLAATAWDRGDAARQVLDREGLTYLDRWRQPRPRPEVAIEHQARRDFAHLLNRLGLDLPAPGK